MLQIPKVSAPDGDYWSVRPPEELHAGNAPRSDLAFMSIELRAWHDAGMMGMTDAVLTYARQCVLSNRQGYEVLLVKAFRAGRAELQLLIENSGIQYQASWSVVWLTGAAGGLFGGLLSMGMSMIPGLMPDLGLATHAIIGTMGGSALAPVIMLRDILPFVGPGRRLPTKPTRITDLPLSARGQGQ